ncbi:prephenate dehydrogenase [Flavisolibacter ginsenosidimutans]|uniref:Prephenate dehydrogenase n=1 Tax=Flavisolibacter ginsenosidimutans TaxID=661481 RepID=A0A5B8UPR4_9BACT|nr:prephenate dehydrogenase [Flavisolibacter ginsenosidimutans]QEC58229.1 prephenate dehydrogenase [Flavisolibacter ginsenosidimutans]
MTVTVVGIGLIGGSMAIALKEKGIATKVIGVDANAGHQQKALDLGLVDEVLDLETAVKVSDLIILSVPVNALLLLVNTVLDNVDRQVMMDAGSTKSGLLDVIKDHPKRGRFVATHPMWGTEYSGPEAAVRGAFTGKATVICNKEESDEDAVALVENIYRQLGMHLVYMNAVDHDVHVAYVSHISHITSFALANTVLEKEKEEEAIFELASGGFESTVRLAKSNPAMWVPIFKENRENVLDVLNEHISQLRKFKACLEKENYEYLQDLIVNANGIKKIIK